MKVPMAYELKRIVSTHGHKFWRNETLRGIAVAPVYVFADQSAFDADDIEHAAMRRMFDPLRLPHAEVIFEVQDQTGERESHLVYARQCGEHIEGVYLYKIGTGKGWTDVLADVTLHQGGAAEVETHPAASEEARQIYPVVATGIIWRALAILSAEHVVERQAVPLMRRRKLARAGVTGWDWNLVSFNPAELKPKSPPLGGTHATPRWHIRRGHWRSLADGRRVFVRECEVGDKPRGGVVKDYEVAA
jgi:hypothetical protein